MLPKDILVRQVNEAQSGEKYFICCDQKRQTGYFRLQNAGIPRFCCASQVLHFSQNEGSIFHQQNDYDSLYYDTHFITVVTKSTVSWRYLCMKLLFVPTEPMVKIN